jgi:hypothetical protein
MGVGGVGVYLSDKATTTGLRESPGINVGREEKFISMKSIPLYW